MKTLVLESPLNRLAGFKICNFLKRLQHRCFRMNIAKFLRTLNLIKSANNCFCHSCFLLVIFLLRGLFLLLIQQAFFKGPLQGLKSSPQSAQWQATLLFEKKKNQPKWSLVVTRCHLLSLVVTCCTTRCHSLSLVATRCHSLYHSLSLIVTCCHSWYHSLSLVVPLIVISCHSLSFVVTSCTNCFHSLLLDVPLVCLFINDRYLDVPENSIQNVFERELVERSCD